MIQTVRVTAHGVKHDTAGKSLLEEIQRLGITTITQVKTARVYRLEGITAEATAALALRLFVDPVTQFATVNEPILGSSGRVIEVAYQPGVMNPEVASILKAARDLEISDLVAADSSTEYAFFGNPTDDEIALILDRLLVNKTVQRVVAEPPATLVIAGVRGTVQTVPLRDRRPDDLVQLSRDRSLFLDLQEMFAIREHFQRLGREPTDGELETIAQTWSEHCCHKTFNAPLLINGTEKPSLMQRLKEATARHSRLVISAFKDNAGVIGFYDDHGILFKVETHNAPSAIEPYGGVGTGVGGLLRDLIGIGQGGKPILSTDMFCFAPPTLPPEQLPPGCLHPLTLLRKAVAGVRDYGNRMGVPTANGSFHFHPDWRAKPTVIVGGGGIVPVQFSQKGTPEPGDQIWVLGGRTGRDGIHGATFSSGVMTDHTITVHATAVQIGNAIEEKRVLDAILACRDRGLIRAITDCGAGGLSSAIGEMGAKTGAQVFLERAPLKYQGLAPWEIWLSEAQERMVVAVAPEHAVAFAAVCADFNVEATCLGDFTNDGRLTVTYDGASVCDLDMRFLHDGRPERILIARHEPPKFAPCALPAPVDWSATYRAVLSHLNVCSKESVVRQYDHGVQGGTALHPFTGVHHDGPNDAVVLQPLAPKPYGVVVAHGLNPVLVRLDPYFGALWAGVEALSNLVAAGGNPRECALIDNFIWPKPDEEHLGALDAAVDACVHLADAFGLPYVSGKDSLSSTYRGKDGTVIHIPPVVCISVFGRIPDVAKTVTADFKQPGSIIVLLGRLTPDLGGSIYADVCGLDGGRPPHVNIVDTTPTIFDRIHKLIGEGTVLSCHDISEGGIAVALAEMCFGGDCGAVVDLGALNDHRPDLSFFSETAGCFLIEVSRMTDIENLFLDLPYEVIGLTTQDPTISLSLDDRKLCTLPVAELKAAWQQPFKEIFH